MKKLLTLFAFFSACAIFGQINYEPGYFLNNNGDRTDCLIRNVAWKDSPSEFDYKASESAEPQKGLIKDVTEFSVNGYKFRRFTVDIDRSYTHVDQMSTSAVPEWQKKTVFLKVMIEGKASLYQYEAGNLVKYFFSTGDNNNAEQLMYREYKDNGVINKNYKFRQQLYMLMKDKMPEMRTYENIRYQKNDLTDLFREYNGGQETEDHAARQNRSAINVKLTPGVSLANVVVENRLNSGRFEFDAKPVFRIGAEIEYIMPFNNNKWSLFADPNIQFYSNDGKGQTFDWKMKYNFVELPFGARHYMFLNNDSKLFIDAAYALALNVGDSYVQYADQRVHLTKSSNVTAGAGFAHKRYSVEVRYGFGRGLTDLYDNWGSTYTSVGIILGYKLF